MRNQIYVGVYNILYIKSSGDFMLALAVKEKKRNIEKGCPFYLLP